ncbi:aspartyl protease family protein At5g10770 [Vitis vinifera]|nr:aspartyl protease family protein At5g10770 [Vitis vinifera]|eukprot:XP_010648778.1 PREDICTED: aspartyl protease family protein At5g10770-like [Vitis vinifera]
MSGYSLLFLYIYCLVLRLTHSAITTESLCVRFMAILCPSTAIYHLLFSSLLLFFSCYVSAIPVYGAEEGKDGFHSTPVSSLLPKNKCSASARGGSQGLPITQKYGPCSGSGHSQPPSPQEIFGRDESRVSFINSKFNQYAPENLKDHTPNNKLFDEDGNFLVDVAFGTPPQKFTLILDTGSSITWTQCKPCVRCLKASRRHFDPSASLTYSLGSCIPSTVGNTYNMTYGDKSTSVGNYGCDTMTLEHSDVFPKFQFGCGRNNEGDFGSGADGMLGLGQGQLSTVSQTASKFKKVFSYCLPEEDSIGSLLFGEKATSQSSSLKFTSLVNGPGTSGLEESGYYFVKLLDISVGNKRLNIPSSVFASPGTIIDSGTVITRLPQRAYSALKAAFKKAMAKYPLSNGRRKKGDILDTCYNLSGRKDVLLPEIVLHFGEGADVRLNGKRVIWGNDASRLCLAFAGNSELTIIGNRQQVSLTVLYDIQGGRIGFGGNGCSK